MKLLEELQACGYRARKQGRTWGANWCPVCGEGDSHANHLCVYVGRDGKERWFCHRCHTRGDLADFIAAARGLSLKEALQAVRKDSPATAAAKAVQPAKTLAEQARQDCERARQACELLLSLTDGVRNPEVERYLLRRGISAAVQQRAIEEGILRHLPPPEKAAQLLAPHRDFLMECGFWGGTGKWPAFAFRPLLFFPRGNTTLEARSIVPDSRYPKSIRMGRLTLPYTWDGDKSCVLVVEGAIDMLSVATLEDPRAIVALPGVSSWRAQWFDSLLKKHGSEFHLGLDADEAGDLAAQAIGKAIESLGGSWRRVIPVEGKDWNEWLLARQSCEV